MQIVLSDIHKFYNYKKADEKHALCGVELSISAGEFVAIVGKSGAGKSTLLHIISCLLGFERGSYFIDGKNVSSFTDGEKSALRAEKFGIVLQEFGLIEGYTALQNVLVPLIFRKKMSNKEKRAMALGALERAGVSELANLRVNKLSGGQRQRIAVARALVNKPGVIIADEPTGSLDEETARSVYSLLQSENERGATVIFVTHDKSLALKSKRIVELAEGKIANDSFL